MSWNYRVVKDKENNIYEIKEIYYKDNGEINAYANAPIPYGESLKDLNGCLKLMMSALSKKTLNIEDLKKDAGIEDISDINGMKEIRICRECGSHSIDFFSAKEVQKEGVNNGEKYNYSVVEIKHICRDCGKVFKEEHYLYK